MLWGVTRTVGVILVAHLFSSVVGMLAAARGTRRGAFVSHVPAKRACSVDQAVSAALKPDCLKLDALRNAPKVPRGAIITSIAGSQKSTTRSNTTPKVLVETNPRSYAQNLASFARSSDCGDTASSLPIGQENTVTRYARAMTLLASSWPVVISHPPTIVAGATGQRAGTKGKSIYTTG
eukprot:6190541-Pleurochrysis_carterae.AAC.2